MPDELLVKVLALKVCRNRCLSHALSEQAIEIATPVLKLFATLLEHDGSLGAQVEEKYGLEYFCFDVPHSFFPHFLCSPKFKSRMRLQAAISLLHLSTKEIFANAIAPKFLRLACVIQVTTVLANPENY